MSGVFDFVKGRRPGRTAFNLSHDKKFTCDMGQLIPILAEDVVPGDIYKLGNQIVIRFQPLVAPILHEINVFVHYFFVPYRILDSDFENRITGGEDGAFSGAFVPWSPVAAENDLGTLWDLFGFPIDVNPLDIQPTIYLKQAYNKIYNDYYRNENLQVPVSLNQYLILNRNWEKDYFTSALPWQQRGTSPALPIMGQTTAVWNGPDTAGGSATLQYGVTNKLPFNQASLDTLNNNIVPLDNAVSFTAQDIRVVFQTQRFLELNARGGVRYTEFLKAHFNVAPRDDRLNRPEYIGGSRTPVIISEVLQTSSTDATSPQGNLAGHGIAVDSNNVGSYRVLEYGVIMGIMSVMPRTVYQQGIDRQYIKRDRFDGWYFPEFANLSEQAVELGEVYATSVPAENRTIFGYQGRYNEMRYRRNLVCGQFRSTFDYWHMSRIFAAAPLLNSEFITCVPTKRIFAVPSEPGLLVNFGNRIKAIRPIPYQAEPGYIDH